MAKIVIEKWQCDYCKKVWDKKPLRTHYPNVTLSYRIGREWSEEAVSYADICQDCSDKLYELIKGFKDGKG